MSLESCLASVLFLIKPDYEVDINTEEEPSPEHSYAGTLISDS